ncbi:hypothetical protein P7K49_013664 [Saguinus oedipus]|uniref:Uncharacterized protein n=1 Tax=Saguinus oedipus TaxID=9490 RepID=A0ABQ9VGL5_SAGOE|nr:hypothetical protein P7K49_013664 [Saguinus oedipus]
MLAVSYPAAEDSSPSSKGGRRMAAPPPWGQIAYPVGTVEDRALGLSGRRSSSEQMPPMVGISQKALLSPNQPEIGQQHQAAWGLQNRAASRDRSRTADSAQLEEAKSLCAAAALCRQQPLGRVWVPGMFYMKHPPCPHLSRLPNSL